MEILGRVYFGNTVLQWATALAIAIITLLVFQVIKFVVVRRLRKVAATTTTDIDDFVVDLLGNTRFILILVLSLYTGSFMLELGPSVRDFITSAAALIFLFQAALWGNAVITFALNRFARQKMEANDASTATVVSMVGMVARIVFTVMIVLVALGTLGFDISALITLAGVGGVAVALAVNGILSDLFGSMTIALDQPFVVGDFITVGDFNGTVENVGLKSTRLRSNTGEQLVMSNADLLGSRLRNFGQMDERRGNLALGVTYDTPADKLEAIPGMIQEIIDREENVRFDRAHFASFGDFSLNFAVVYWLLTPAYGDFMNATQAINLAIVRRFEAEGIEMAFPTQTLYLNKEAG